MFRFSTAFLTLIALFALFSPESALAEECDFTWVLVNEDGSKATPEQHAEKARRETECKQRLADQKRDGAAARARLASEFEVDASKLDDVQAINRLQSELDARKRAADDAQERRRLLEESQRASQAGKLMDDQSKMLQELGVEIDEDGDEGDDEGVDATELKMYQEMLRNGIAPQCKGKQDQALIDCVDDVLDAE
jgi:hypothetical protein